MPIITYQENEACIWQYNADSLGRATQIIGFNKTPNASVPAMYTKGYIDVYNAQGTFLFRESRTLAPGQSTTMNLSQQARFDPNNDPVSIGFEEWLA